MKGHWFYLIHCFAGAEKLEKQLKKLREPWEYEVVVNRDLHPAAGGKQLKSSHMQKKPAVLQDSGAEKDRITR